MATLNDYQSQDSINSSKRGSTDRSLGGTPVQQTQYVTDKPSHTEWYVGGAVLILIVIVSLVLLRRAKKS